ncbi:hypothetical protein [Streptomyces millisiae]|uniref:Uncharacterized protein n=1 Tax=Streptomyces millisiae TaxID=3075542 RepID=A0ABU2LMK6_9ACTN|nr:hypothetical protein [Streptomyces sp. DSM 44918]MDT0318816.1 hypothetical protein [Streptomyces sp. DSM 44918]
MSEDGLYVIPDRFRESARMSLTDEADRLLDEWRKGPGSRS